MSEKRTTDSPTSRSRLFAHAAMALYTVLVAGSFSFGALAAPHIDPLALTAVRFLFAALLMGMLTAVVLRRAPQIPTAMWRYLVLGTLMGVFFVLMFVALRITNPVSTGAVFTLIPLMSAFFDYLFLRQLTNMTVAASLIVSAIGALWVIFHGDFDRALTFDVGRGEAIFFIGCACQAAYGPLVRLLNCGESVFEFTLWTLVAATVCVGVFAAPQIVSTDWLELPSVVWYCIAYLTVFSTAASFFLLQYASMWLPAAKVFAYGYLVPSIVILSEGFLGHGWVDRLVAVGAVITVAGLSVLFVAPDE